MFTSLTRLAALAALTVALLGTTACTQTVAGAHASSADFLSSAAAGGADAAPLYHSGLGL